MSSWSTSPLTWFITGAASGFGLELTRLALFHGHKIAEVEDRGGQWLALAVDDVDCGTITEDLENQGIAIDILVNSAGWSIHAPAETFSEDEARRQMETVFFGPYRLIRAVIPHMRQRRQGLILNISSGAGVQGRETMGIYGASKAAMDDGLIRIMAKEVAPFNVRTLTVYLGWFDNNFASAIRTSENPMPEDYKATMTSRIVDGLRGSDARPNGDHRKASKIIYEMAMSEGFGSGKEDERIMFLGRDMTVTMDAVFAALKHQMAMFREISHNASLYK